MKLARANQKNFLSEINIIPLVDVILVLLIVFMITAPLLQHGLDVELPQTMAAAMPQGESDIVLTIDRHGKLYLHNEKTPYELKGIQAKLERIYRHRKKKEIFVRADTRVSYGFVTDTLSILKRSGIDRVGLVTESPKK